MAGERGRLWDTFNPAVGRMFDACQPRPLQRGLRRIPETTLRRIESDARFLLAAMAGFQILMLFSSVLLVKLKSDRSPRPLSMARNWLHGSLVVLLTDAVVFSMLALEQIATRGR